MVTTVLTIPLFGISSDTHAQKKVLNDIKIMIFIIMNN